MTQRVAKAAFVVIALCMVVRGQVQSSSPKASEPTRGTISGKVVNENGQPLAGAFAYVRPINSPAAGRTTITDADGYFQVENLTPALYTVGANAPAYTPMPSDPGAPAYYRIGDSVNLQLVRGGVITGTVTNSLGEPVVAIRVRATMVRDAKGKTGRLSYAYFMEQSTDDRGIYRLYGLAPGSYLVSAGGYGSTQSFQFSPYESDVPTYAPSSTRDDAAEVSVTAGDETDVDIRYRGEAGHTISGTVKVAGTNGSSVSLLPVGSAMMPASNYFQAPGARGFSFNGLSDGEYDLVAEEFTQTSTPPVISVSEPKRVSVKGANVSGIELTPLPLAQISGRIVFQPSKLAECQGKRPPLLSETLVQFRRPERDPQKEPYQRSHGISASPDATGGFVLRNMSPGKYQFDPRFYARYWYLQSITLPNATGSGPRSQTSRASDAAANWTVVKSGDQLNNLTITIAEGAASIRGKSMAAEPPTGMSLFLVPAEADKADDVLRFFVTEIVAGGTFALNNLPPGRYWLLTQTNADAQVTKIEKLREPEAAAARTKLRRSAETQKTEIELKPCQNLADYQLKH